MTITLQLLLVLLLRMMCSIALPLSCRLYCVDVSWCGWIRTRVKAAMKQLKHRGPPLLFTMHLCLVGSKSMDFDIQWLERHAKDIGKHREDVEAAIGMGPSPSFICTSILKADNS